MLRKPYLIKKRLKRNFSKRLLWIISKFYFKFANKLINSNKAPKSINDIDPIDRVPIVG